MPNGDRFDLGEFESLKKIRERAFEALRRFDQSQQPPQPEQALQALQDFAQAVVAFRTRVRVLRRQLFENSIYADALGQQFDLEATEANLRILLNLIRGRAGVIAAGVRLITERQRRFIESLVGQGLLVLTQEEEDAITSGSLTLFEATEIIDRRTDLEQAVKQEGPLKRVTATARAVLIGSRLLDIAGRLRTGRASRTAATQEVAILLEQFGIPQTVCRESQWGRPPDDREPPTAPAGGPRD